MGGFNIRREKSRTFLSVRAEQKKVLRMRASVVFDVVHPLVLAMGGCLRYSRKTHTRGLFCCGRSCNKRAAKTSSLGFKKRPWLQKFFLREFFSMACLCCCEKNFFLTRSASLHVLHNSISMESKYWSWRKSTMDDPWSTSTRRVWNSHRKRNISIGFAKKATFEAFMWTACSFTNSSQDGLVDEDPELLLPAGRLKRTFIQLMEDIQRFGGTLSE